MWSSCPFSPPLSYCWVNWGPHGCSDLPKDTAGTWVLEGLRLRVWKMWVWELALPRAVTQWPLSCCTLSIWPIKWDSNCCPDYISDSWRTEWRNSYSSKHLWSTYFPNVLILRATHPLLTAVLLLRYNNDFILKMRDIHERHNLHEQIMELEDNRGLIWT